MEHRSPARWCPEGLSSTAWLHHRTRPISCFSRECDARRSLLPPPLPPPCPLAAKTRRGFGFAAVPPRAEVSPWHSTPGFLFFFLTVLFSSVCWHRGGAATLAIFGRLVSSVRQSLPPDVDKWGVSLQLLMGAVVVGGVVVAGCYEWMQQNVITDLECVDASRYTAMLCCSVVLCRMTLSFVVRCAVDGAVGFFSIASGGFRLRLYVAHAPSLDQLDVSLLLYHANVATIVLSGAADKGAAVLLLLLSLKKKNEKCRPCRYCCRRLLCCCSVGCSSCGRHRHCRCFRCCHSCATAVWLGDLPSCFDNAR